jgi:hypothetical protein
MSRRVLVLVLAAVVAVAVVVPALANSGTTAKSASVKGLSVRALAKAKAALRIARSAKRDIHRSAAAATAAQGAATAAQGSASAANTSSAAAIKAAEGASMKAGGAELNSKEAKEAVAGTRPGIGFAEGSASTTSEGFAKLAGGPAVTISVPQTGLVQVWAQATIEGEGAVSLYEDGAQVAGQAECAAPETGQGGLFAVSPVGPSEPPLTVGTPASGVLCSTSGAPGPVLFETTGGSHTYELRYAACGCEESKPPLKATFSGRRLIVQALP